MSDGLLLEIKQFFIRAFAIFPTLLKVVGAVGLVFSITLVGYEILIKNKHEARIEAIKQLPFIVLGSFIISSILLILGFYAANI